MLLIISLNRADKTHKNNKIHQSTIAESINRVIHFGTGKSVIKSESDKALTEIAQLLKGDVKLEVNIVDHTDRVGWIGSNMKVSQDRANPVVQTLMEICNGGRWLEGLRGRPAQPGCLE